MSHTLNAHRDERARWPYAVSTQLPGEAEPTVVHFDHLGSAALYATLMDTEHSNLRLFVANLSTAILFSSHLGWHEVGSFDPALSDEVRRAEAAISAGLAGVSA